MNSEIHFTFKPIKKEYKNIELIFSLMKYKKYFLKL